MITKKYYIIDSIFSLIILAIMVKFIPYLSIKIVSISALVTYTIASILLNLNKYLYFLSTLVGGILFTTMMTLLLIPFTKDEQIVLWLLYSISWVVIIITILTKKSIFEILTTKPLPGEKGIIGDKGAPGKAYFLKTYPEKSYNEIILNIESFLNQNKKDNKIPFEEGDEHMKNNYLKELFRRIVYSKEYGDYLSDVNKVCTYLDASGNRKCVDKSSIGNVSCDINNDCASNNKLNVEMRYRKITDYLKIMTLEYIKEILRNNCAEEQTLKERNLGQLSDENYIYYRNLNELYNSKSGHKFIDDYFLNQEFFDTYLVKKNPNVDCDADGTEGPDDKPKYNNRLERIKKIDISNLQQSELSTTSVSRTQTDYTDLSRLGSPYFWGMGQCKK